ncbi:hypothetical protein FQN54_006722 [Arachnomyces sp. PD_36]|nr:hypothetical protein FQN54_006722 [Arachnomyces sp. PD_36]
MSNKSLEQALSQLLPTHDNDLPPELVNLSISLLAQSRSYASSLKPEEEIARPYVCAEIACKRLAPSLNLPPPVSRPPCPPRVYKKLYTYLEQSLAKSSTRPKRQAATTPSSTPKKAQSKNPTPSSTVPAKRTRAGVSKNAVTETPKTSIKDAPTWAMPLVRRICKTLSTPTSTSTGRSRPAISSSFPPHIFAGVSSILSFIPESNTAEKRAEDKDLDEFLTPFDKGGAEEEVKKDMIKTMIVATYFIVLSRRRNYLMGKSGVKPSSSVPPRELDRKTYNEMCDTALSSVGLSPDQKHLRQEVDLWIDYITECGWSKGMEWFENIPLPGDREGDDALDAGDTQAGENDDDGDDSGPLGPNRRRRRKVATGKDKVRGGLQPGLGTMMQDRIDWLSEDRKADYSEWKEEIMERIRGMEKGKKRAAAR